MDKDDKKSVAMFGFKRSAVQKGPARAVVAVAILVIIFAVWFVVIRH